MREQTPRSATIRAGALLALLACGAATAAGEGGEGNSGTDRGQRAQHLPTLCRTSETAVAVRQADGTIAWRCAATERAATAPKTRG